MAPELKEIRRERVAIPMNLSIQELMKKYGIADTTARNAKKRGWFTKNYMQKQVIIDRENFRPEICYSIAKQVFFKNFRKNPVAQNIKEDLIQEAVSRMFELSGKVKENANEKYGENYGYWWVAHNGMLAYLKTWIRQTEHDCEIRDDMHPIMYHGNRRWSPEYGWMYC